MTFILSGHRAAVYFRKMFVRINGIPATHGFRYFLFKGRLINVGQFVEDNLHLQKIPSEIPTYLQMFIYQLDPSSFVVFFMQHS